MFMWEELIGLEVSHACLQVNPRNVSFQERTHITQASIMAQVVPDVL
jgi:hypothetical protein